VSILRFFTCVLAAGLMVLGADTAPGQAYPAKPVRIVTAPIGGGNDFVARVISQGLSGSLGQQLVVDNRPAAIVGEVVANAPPDGYTLLVIGSVLWLTPLLQDNAPYDPVKDFAPISIPGRSINILVVHPSVPAKTVKELVDFARSRPGQLNYATGATGASNHLAAELFKHMAHLNLVRIPYKGAGPAVSDLVSGQVHMMFPTTASGLPHVRSGRLRALAVSSLHPSALAPGLPSVAEAGLPGYESVVMYALFAPAKTPAAIIKRLNAEVVHALRSKMATERMFNSGVEVVASSPGELAAGIEAEMTKIGKLIRDANLRAR